MSPNRSPRRPRTIRFWLAALVLVSIVPIIAGTGFLLSRSVSSERANVEASQISVARGLAQAVDGELIGAVAILTTLAGSPHLEAGDLAAFHTTARRAIATTSGRDILLVLPDGTQVMNTLEPFSPLPGVSQADIQHRDVDAGGPFVTKIIQDRISKRPLAIVQMPVVFRGQVKYDLVMTLQLDRFVDILLRQHLPADSIATLFDQHGVIVARTRNADRFVGAPGPSEVVETFAKAYDDTLTTTIDGNSVHAAYSRSQFSGWTVVIGSAMWGMSGVGQSLWLGVGIVLGTLLVAVALAIFISARISRAISALEVPALTWAYGGTLTLPPSEISEVDSLRLALLRTATMVERRVKERDDAEDIQKRMALATQTAKQASRAKSDFLTSMSHELRTPLHGILGYAEMIRREGDLSFTQSERIDFMLSAGRHLLSLINSVLDLSQIEANQLDLHPALFDLGTLAQICVDMALPLALDKELDLRLYQPAPLRLMADPTRLSQVLNNLLKNAIAFTHHGYVELRIEADADTGLVRMDVADTGPGVPATLRHKLFSTFGRLNPSTLQTVEGAGLGLALSARFAKLMGGRLSHHDNPAGGSIFRLELPIGEFSEMPAELTAAAEPGPLPSALRVLVVDDVEMNRVIACAFLAGDGCKTACASSGEAAVAAAADDDYDAVLMDVRMDGIGGLEAARRIRTLAGRRGRVPIVAVTALAFTEQVDECRAAGMQMHLAKPFDRVQLRAAVANAVATARSVDGPRRSPVAPTNTPGLVSGEDLPIVDEPALEQTASFLTGAAVASYLHTTSNMADDLRRGLRERRWSPKELAAKAHALAGPAGIFGLTRLASTARTYEHRVQTSPDSTWDAAGALADAADETQQAIEELLKRYEPGQPVR